jgi:hypothetical protein
MFELNFEGFPLLLARPSLVKLFSSSNGLELHWSNAQIIFPHEERIITVARWS